MNLLDMIKQVLAFQDWKKASSLPGWRARPTRDKGRAEPFHSARKREPGILHMHIEEFATREARNQRYHELREKGTRNLSRMTDQRDGRIVWQLLRP